MFEITFVHRCREVTTSAGVLLWKGLRVKMSVYPGVPNCEHDTTTDRMVYVRHLIHLKSI